MTEPRPRGATTGLLLGVALAAFAVRWAVAARLPTHLSHPGALFARPWHRPPLLDLLTVPFGDARHGVAIALGALAAAAVTALAARALPRRGVLAVAVGAVFLPSMVWAGALWAHAALVVPATLLTAAVLVATLEEPRSGFAAPLAFATWALLLTDWPAWAPVIAWLGRLAVFPPEDLDAASVRRAAIALGAGLAGALPVYGVLLAHGASPEVALAAKDVPLGPEAVRALLDSLAGIALGRVRGVPPAGLGLLAGLVLVAVTVGGKRAARAGRTAWGDVLAVGSLGAFVPALAAQPWIPLAADKNVWYMGPLVLCLAAAAAFGVLPRPSAATDEAVE